MAVNLLDWLQQIADCRDNPDAINFDGAEEALEELRQRAADCWAECDEEDDSPQTNLLREMAATMERIAEQLDAFLETELFYHLQDALEDCRALFQLRDMVEAADENPEIYD
jgi:hypothetical protein